jgi:hypothetical protein
MIFCTSSSLRVIALFMVVLCCCGDNGDDSSLDASSADGAVATTDGAAGSDGATGICTASDFENDVVAFCSTQNPSPPAAGELGAPCADDDSQCTSNICLHPYGQTVAYCSMACPQGDECPVGFSCQDSGTRGPLCYEGVCIYGGADSSDCITTMTKEAQAACGQGCGEKFSAWLDCLNKAGRICGKTHADSECGIERGLLESCCSLCNDQEL